MPGDLLSLQLTLEQLDKGLTVSRLVGLTGAAYAVRTAVRNACAVRPERPITSPKKRIFIGLWRANV